MASNLQNTPSYPIPEVAGYLKVPTATLRTWVLGRSYPTKQGRGRSEPLIKLADPEANLMSFTNLVEAHVLSAIRRQHEIPMDKVRLALNFLEKQYNSEHPLADNHFLTDGEDLFIRELNQVINITRSGQLGIQKALAVYIKRIIRDEHGRLLRLYPMSASGLSDAKPVMVDPRVSFGRLVIAETGIPVNVLVSRFNAGDSLDELAEDYHCEKEQIETAI